MAQTRFLASRSSSTPPRTFSKHRLEWLFQISLRSPEDTDQLFIFVLSNFVALLADLIVCRVLFIDRKCSLTFWNLPSRNQTHKSGSSVSFPYFPEDDLPLWGLYFKRLFYNFSSYKAHFEQHLCIGARYRFGAYSSKRLFDTLFCVSASILASYDFDKDTCSPSGSVLFKSFAPSNSSRRE